MGVAVSVEVVWAAAAELVVEAELAAEDSTDRRCAPVVGADKSAAVERVPVKVAAALGMEAETDLVAASHREAVGTGRVEAEIDPMVD